MAGFSKGEEQQRLSPVDRANLVAYLDGELNEAETRAIATKLTMSPTARREVESLEKTWELLDHLPLPKAPEDFTQRTLTQTRRLDEKGGRFESAFVSAARSAARLGVWVAGAVVAFGIGYGLTQWVWPNPSARLARDLSIAEHFDEYREVGTIDYLKQLANSPEFGTEHDD